MPGLRAAFMASLIALILVIHASPGAAIPLNTTDLSSAPIGCLWEFSVAICGSGVGDQVVNYPEGSTTCIPLQTTMSAKNVWTNECSSWFGACTMWIQSDCTGAGSLRIDDPSNTHLGTCFSEYYYFNAVSCEAAG